MPPAAPAWCGRENRSGSGWTVRARPPGRLGRRSVTVSKSFMKTADLVVVNKPAGLLTVPLDGDSSAPSVLALLWDRFRSHRTREPLVVHRIDKDTSGLVLFALHETARAALVAQFAHRTPDRVYLALVNGHPDPAEGTWHDRLTWDEDAFVQRRSRADDPEARDAECAYRVVSTFAEASLLEVRLRTGRQGQIRAQAQLHGHSLVGDRRYRPREGAPGHELAIPQAGAARAAAGLRPPVRWPSGGVHGADTRRPARVPRQVAAAGAPGRVAAPIAGMVAPGI